MKKKCKNIRKARIIVISRYKDSVQGSGPLARRWRTLDLTSRQTLLYRTISAPHGFRKTKRKRDTSRWLEQIFGIPLRRVTIILLACKVLTKHNLLLQASGQATTTIENKLGSAQYVTDDFLSILILVDDNNSLPHLFAHKGLHYIHHDMQPGGCIHHVAGFHFDGQASNGHTIQSRIHFHGKRRHARPKRHFANIFHNEHTILLRLLVQHNEMHGPHKKAQKFQDGQFSRSNSLQIHIFQITPPYQAPLLIIG